jgi:tRNA dimethylallyltransferase
VVKKSLIVVVGPTGIGKTSLAITLAQERGTEIISADSRQIFKEMSIGTAKPTAEELAAVPHHFVGRMSIHDSYSAGQFERDALAKIEELHTKHDTVIMVGGSGLYVNAVLYGFDDLPGDSTIRATLKGRLEAEGLESLVTQLQSLDPISAERVDAQNPQRVLRALEVCLSSGKPYSSLLNSGGKERPFDIVLIGLTAAREVVYERINQRVDQMMASGLLEEAKNLFEFRHLNALQTVGYQELFTHLEGQCTLDEAVELIKQNTRRFAKRQYTWFKKLEGLRWFEVGEEVDLCF